MLATITSVSPIPLLLLWASLRDRAGLPSPLRGLVPPGGHPSPLRSLTLAARSPCPGGSLRSPPIAWPPARCSASAQWQFHRLIRSRWRCAPGSSPAAPSRIGSPRRHSLSRTPPCYPRAPSPSAQAPRRLPFGSRIRNLISPVVRYLGNRVLSHSLRCLGIHTRRTDGACRCILVPRILLVCA